MYGVQCWRLTASLKQSRKHNAELKEALQVIWGNLPQGPIDKALIDFSNKAYSTTSHISLYNLFN